MVQSPTPQLVAASRLIELALKTQQEILNDCRGWKFEQDFAGSLFIIYNDSSIPTDPILII